jgi:branched-chain amino acid transport system ATP-binding protein
VTGLTKTFGGLKAVDAASLQVAQGSIVALIGPNGAGKTTLFSCMSGFQKFDAGRVELEGEDITGLPPHAIARRGMVRTFQITQPFAGLTVHENIAIGAWQQYPDRNQAWEHAQRIGRQLGMDKLLIHNASALTVAGRKRLELARTLATGPRLLLLDEVMAGLNPSEILETVEMVQAIRASGVTIVLIEHVMQAVMRLADTICVLSNGKVIAEGEPQAVVSDRAVVEAYLGRGAADRLARTQDPAQEAGHA